MATDGSLAPGSPWTEEEVHRTVADYFRMLSHELQGEPYNKAQHNRELRRHLHDRSQASVEFKHANISAVLIGMGHPYIRGYQPRRNVQGLLREAVEHYLDEHPDIASLAEGSLEGLQDQPPSPLVPFSEIVEPPPGEIVVPESDRTPWRSRRGRRLDLAALEARHRVLGDQGEEFVVRLEKRRLEEAGRDDLASKVDWVARSRGDGLGFDVLSYDDTTDAERLIEVKTTTQGRHFPFYLTRTEVRCSQDVRDHFHLYRLFDFKISPRLYTLHGALDATLNLEPIAYQASLRPPGAA